MWFKCYLPRQGGGYSSGGGYNRGGYGGGGGGGGGYGGSRGGGYTGGMSIQERTEMKRSREAWNDGGNDGKTARGDSVLFTYIIFFGSLSLPSLLLQIPFVWFWVGKERWVKKGASLCVGLEK